MILEIFCPTYPRFKSICLATALAAYGCVDKVPVIVVRLDMSIGPAKVGLDHLLKNFLRFFCVPA